MYGIGKKYFLEAELKKSGDSLHSAGIRKFLGIFFVNRNAKTGDMKTQNEVHRKTPHPRLPCHLFGVVI